MSEKTAQTHAREFVLDLPVQEPTPLLIPKAPGFHWDVSIDESKKKEYSSRFDALEEAIRRVIDDLPYTGERLALNCGHDRWEGRQSVRLKCGKLVFWEILFNHMGEVELRNDEDSKSEQIASSWKEGVAHLLLLLHGEAEIDMQAAAERLEKLNACKVEEI